MLLGRLQVLTDAKNIGAHIDHVFHDLLDLIFLLANAKHNAGLGYEAAGLGIFEHPKGSS